MSKLACPVCHKPLPDGVETKTFPFCSDRCKMVDLGRWLNGEYVYGEPLEQTPPDDEPPADPRLS